MKEHELALWCIKQARLHKEGKLSRDKVELLEKINFPFEYYLEMKE